MTDQLDRRGFLKAGAVAAVGSALSSALAQTTQPTTAPDTQPATAPSTQPITAPQTQPAGRMAWAALLHLSYNMWCDWDSPERAGRHGVYRPDLRLDRAVWDDLLRQMANLGMNRVVIDLGDGVQYESHPEIAVKNAWTPEQLRTELAAVRRLGLEPIPKLNFSTTHDAWLGRYSRCVSTDAYYAVCRDLIAEVIRLFEKPRFFHLGMDEEWAQDQRDYQYIVVRQHDLWWRDLYLYVDEVAKGGSRPWIWSDHLWRHPEEFYAKMPKSVVQSNWYYETKFEKDVTPVKAYDDLEAHGYDQIPTGSNWSSPDNFGLTVEYGRRHVAPERLLGFLQTAWQPTLEVCRKTHTEAIDQAGKAIAAFTAK